MRDCSRTKDNELHYMEPCQRVPLTLIKLSTNTKPRSDSVEGETRRSVVEIIEDNQTCLMRALQK